MDKEDQRFFIEQVVTFALIALFVFLAMKYGG